MSFTVIVVVDDSEGVGGENAAVTVTVTVISTSSFPPSFSSPCGSTGTTDVKAIVSVVFEGSTCTVFVVVIVVVDGVEFESLPSTATTEYVGLLLRRLFWY